MNVNELMIGDWVLANGTPTQVEDILGGGGINPEMNGPEIWNWISEEEIQPIPLTADIITKFGFNHLEGNQYRMTIASSQVDIHELGISVWFVEVEELKWDMPTQSAIVCSVHQLQHALRLFGVNKEGVEIG